MTRRHAVRRAAVETVAMRRSPSQAPTRWFVVLAFAVAMAWVEAACAYDLRVLVDRVDPYQANPLPMIGILGQAELVREGATLVMIAAVGWLAGQTRAARLGYAAMAFGVWDVFYYVFLRLIGGWPRSVFDWDVLFLLPLPWWGPVLAPVCVALLLVAGGAVTSRADAVGHVLPIPVRWWRASWAGIALALYVFMADALDAAWHGRDVTTVLPQTFDWPVFWMAVALMAAPVAAIAWRLVAVRMPHGLHAQP